MAQRGRVRMHVGAVVTVLALLMNALDLFLGQQPGQAPGFGLLIAGFWAGLFWGDDHRNGRHHAPGEHNSEPLPPAALGGAARA